MAGPSNEEFVRVWQAASNVKEVADKLGMGSATASSKALVLRRRGVRLKRFKERRTIEPDRLNAIIDEMASNGKPKE